MVNDALADAEPAQGGHQEQDVSDYRVAGWGPLPSETKQERWRRTRPDPFDGVWEMVASLAYAPIHRRDTAAVVRRGMRDQGSG